MLCLGWTKNDEQKISFLQAIVIKLTINLLFTIHGPLDIGKEEFSMVRELVAINEVIGEMAGMLRSESRRRGVSIRTGIRDDLPIDRWRIACNFQQVLVNLMLNAIQAIKNSTRCNRVAMFSWLQPSLIIFGLRRRPLNGGILSTRKISRGLAQGQRRPPKKSLSYPYERSYVRTAR